MLEKPIFLQGVFEFTGYGLTKPSALEGAPPYHVPFDKRAQLVYFRGGNSSDALISLILVRDGKPMRYFPIGARAAIHVPLAVVEDLHPETTVAVQVAAPPGINGSVILDIGMVEF